MYDAIFSPMKNYCQALKVRAEGRNNKHVLTIENTGDQDIFEVETLLRGNEDCPTIEFESIPKIPASSTGITSDNAGDLIMLHPAVFSGIAILLLTFTYSDGRRDKCPINLAQVSWDARGQTSIINS
jgi:hypothetical protein